MPSWLTYKTFICPRCPERGSKSPKNGKYKLYETQTHLVVRCPYCGWRQHFEKSCEETEKLLLIDQPTVKQTQDIERKIKQEANARKKTV